MPGNWQRNEPRGAPPPPSPPSPPPSPPSPLPPSEEDKPVFTAEDPRRTLDDLIVPGSVRHRIESALSLLRNHDTLFIAWNLAKIDPYHRGTAVNLYGPSRRGKAMCAEALAHEVGLPFMNV